MRWLCLAGLFLVTGCGSGSDPVRGTIEEMVRAAEKRDAPSVMDRLAPDFQAADGTGRADMESALRGYFAAYERLDVRISDLTIERAVGAARARFRAELSGKPRQIAGLDGWLPRTASYRFDLRLSPDLRGRWLVTSAGWEEAPGR
ncbi:MAG TPA: nuclear transport factor 2 family protein [Thermoanaerobaculia bacterium]